MRPQKRRMPMHLYVSLSHVCVSVWARTHTSYVNLQVAQNLLSILVDTVLSTPYLTSNTYVTIAARTFEGYNAIF